MAVSNMVDIHLPHAAGDIDKQTNCVTEVIASGRWLPHFQPIGRLRDGDVFAHEALIRGPAGHPLATPDALFAAAHAQGKSFDLEIYCVQMALRFWAQQGMHGKLFVNLSASSLVSLLSNPIIHSIASEIKTLGIKIPDLVVEITEHERVDDLPGLLRAAAALRIQGTQLALDDFGDGRSSLRLWAELKPDFVKIDKYFSKAIAAHPDKVQTIRALKRIADTFDTQMVAEGLETADELRVSRDLGIDLGQGYLLGKPAPELVTQLPQLALEVILSREIAVLPERARSGRTDFNVSEIVEKVTPLDATATHQEVAQRFMSDVALKSIAIVEPDGTPMALINRSAFFNQYSKPYFKEIYGSRSCLLFANMEPLILSSHMGIDEMAEVLTSEDQRYLSEGFIITKGGKYFGMGTGERLVRSVTELRIEAARHANPLTFLPGNIPLTMHISRLLQIGSEFVACYADLNHFKPFNDYYGYWQGDEMIRLLAQTLIANCDVRRDFVGHVGGDDFVVLFQSEDWQQRIENIVRQFNQQAPILFDADARQRGGIDVEDREGVMRFFPMTTLSAGALAVTPGSFQRAEGVASAAAYAKHKAKQTEGGIFIDTPCALTEPAELADMAEA